MYSYDEEVEDETNLIDEELLEVYSEPEDLSSNSEEDSDSEASSSDDEDGDPQKVTTRGRSNSLVTVFNNELSNFQNSNSIQFKKAIETSCKY
jgi:hypothetical protein